MEKKLSIFNMVVWLCYLAAPVLIIAGIWNYDWRWAATGAVILLVGMLFAAVNAARKDKQEASLRLNQWGGHK